MLFSETMEALRIGTGFLWTAGWAITMGLMITSWVQVYVPKAKIAALLGKPELAALAKATGLGAASSGCSFGAVAIGKGIFKKGAHPVNVMAFMFASTNLIVELGLMILIFFGWEFLLAEILGGVVLIAIMAVLVRWTLPEAIFDEARETLNASDEARKVGGDPVCGTEGSDEFTVQEGGRTLRFCSEGCRESYRQQAAAKGRWRDVAFSWSGWFRLGNQYRMEWSMIWKDVVAGFMISGFVIVFVPRSVWNALFLSGEGTWAAAENALMGVAVAVISFVGSIGNVPFAVALWAGGVSFAGVIAFVYSDLITIPVLNVYRKYYGWKVMFYIFGIFFLTMAVSGFLMEEFFALLGIIPEVASGQSAREQEYFSFNYTFWLNLLAVGLSGFLYWVYRAKPKGPYRDPVCGMPVPEDAPEEVVDGETFRFCSKRCRSRFVRDPGHFTASAETA